MAKTKVGVIGVGMVGTPLKRYFEEIKGYQRGKELFLYDIDPKKGYFDDVNKADVIFISVPTPSSHDGSANISAVDSALRMLKDGKVAVIKSTVPPGTTEYLQKKYPRHKLIFNPEFLTESRAWEDMLSPDRQIVGHTVASKSFASHVLSLLPTAFFASPGTLGTYTFVRINATEAELGKYAGNFFGAMKVAFGNVMKDFCDALNLSSKKSGVVSEIEYNNVRAMLAHDRRIGDAWLNADYHNYRGYGGYCFTKDTIALIKKGSELLKIIPARSPESARLVAGLKFLGAIREYNKTLLKTQGLTEEDVSVHDHEWIKKKIKGLV